MSDQLMPITDYRYDHHQPIGAPVSRKQDAPTKNSSQFELEILEASLDGFVHMNADCTILGWNSQAEKIFGWSKSEAIGQNFNALIIPADVPQVHLDDLVCDSKDGKSKILNKRLTINARHRDDKKLLLIELSLSIIQNATEIEYGAFIRDITESSIAEKKLRESEEKYRSLVEDAADIILTIDRNYHIQFVNHVIPQLKREDVIGASALDFIPPSEQSRVSAVFEEIFTTHKSQKYLTDMMLADGSKMWFSTNANPIFSGKEVVGITLLTRDITDIKRAEETLKQQHEQLIESAKLSSLGEMAAGVAHEINNPLAIIYGLASQTLRRHEAGTLDSEKLHKNLLTILSTTERIAKIVRGLKTFSRDATEDPLEITSVQQIIEDTLELCKEKFRIDSIDLKIICDDSFFIKCRPSQISQVLMNLLSNSHDAIEGAAEKWVEIRVEKDQSSLKLMVTDSGNGIRPEILAKIMRPFFTTKEAGKGTGLGLSISRSIIDSHAGRLYYDETCPNTRFVIELPLMITPSGAQDAIV